MIFALFALLMADQTSDAATVATFLAAVQRGDRSAAGSLLSADVFFGDYAQARRAGIDDFIEYARQCRLSTIRTIAVDTRLPVGVTWKCAYPQQDHEASFWFVGPQISRVGWGPPAVVRMVPAR